MKLKQESPFCVFFVALEELAFENLSSIQSPDFFYDILNAPSIESVVAQIRLNDEWTTSVWRLDLNLSVSPWNLDKPNTIIICSRMRDLQLGNFNTRKLGSKPLNNMINVSRHTRTAND